MTTIVVEPEVPDVLVFDETITTWVGDGDSLTDFLVFDAPDPLSPVVQQRTQDEVRDVLAITSDGPPGPTGNQGPEGPQGPAGVNGTGAYFQTFGFASPSLAWNIDLPDGLSAFAVSIETFDTNGEPIEGNVRRPSAFRIEVDWYYPTAGQACLFR